MNAHMPAYASTTTRTATPVGRNLLVIHVVTMIIRQTARRFTARLASTVGVWYVWLLQSYSLLCDSIFYIDVCWPM